MYALAAASVLAVKYKIMTDGGYRIVARLAGLDEHALGTLSRLHFFAFDLLVLAAIVPAALLLLRLLCGRVAAARASMALSLALILVSFMNLQALGATGKLLSLDDLAPMWTWVREQPGALFDYVSPRSLGRLALLLLVAWASYWFRHSPLLSMGRHMALPATVLCTLLSAAAVCGMALDRSPVTSFHASTTLEMLGALVAPEQEGVAGPELAQASSRLNYQCEEARPAKPRRPNVVLFIMETIPYDLFTSKYASGLTTFKELEKSAYVSHRHYSTYPFTSYARFSLFTGLYPSFRLEKTLPLQAHYPFKSAFRSLVDEGYELKVFDPITRRYPVDDWVVHQLGGKVVSADRGATTAEKDERVLSSLVGHIAQAAQAATPFVYAILPQISHGPWLPAGASKQDLYREGASRLGKLDSDLGRIVDALKRAGVYQDTVIVVTADHGLRTSKEAGFLSTQVLNSVSYHVPLIIHDPQLGKTHALPHPTTHLDISPTLHCLYAHGQRGIETQGMSMLSPKAQSRTVHFGGAWYSGSDGLWDGQAFYSYNRQLGMLWTSPRFDFSDAQPLTAGVTKAAIVERLQRQEALQQALLQRRASAPGLDTVSINATSMQQR
ncbi:sulfatase-like hydrolase/transferase [Massilia niastensis]|uniref:sulfatase-like hydrolase/transferase n=1 Tax=Massilia niastensis TaxID=544911 RepID=UPI00146E74CC|nr:sulfatase-like hydrolase/transferase [Massilia niastensis]